ncbi:hypothetical protein M3J09_010378 [Ascochyta lentis]
MFADKLRFVCYIIGDLQLVHHSSSPITCYSALIELAPLSIWPSVSTVSLQQIEIRRLHRASFPLHKAA